MFPFARESYLCQNFASWFFWNTLLRFGKSLSGSHISRTSSLSLCLRNIMRFSCLLQSLYLTEHVKAHFMSDKLPQSPVPIWKITLKPRYCLVNHFNPRPSRQSLQIPGHAWKTILKTFYKAFFKYFWPFISHLPFTSSPCLLYGKFVSHLPFVSSPFPFTIFPAFCIKNISLIQPTFYDFFIAFCMKSYLIIHLL